MRWDTTSADLQVRDERSIERGSSSGWERFDLPS